MDQREMQYDNRHTGSLRVTTIVMLVALEPRPALRAEDTTPGWEDLVPDVEQELIEA